MAIFAVAIVALGAIVSAYATYQQGQAASAAAKAQSRIAENQAIAARNQAQVARDNIAIAQRAAEAEARDARQRHRRILATQRAHIGAAGIMGSEGTPLIVQVESEQEAALDQARILYAGTLRGYGLEAQARGYESQALTFESESRLRSFEARQARRGAVIGAGASLLSGAGSAYGTYSGYRQGSGTSGSTSYGSYRY